MVSITRTIIMTISVFTTNSIYKNYDDNFDYDNNDTKGITRIITMVGNTMGNIAKTILL